MKLTRKRHKFISFIIVGAGAFAIDWGFFNLFYFFNLDFSIALFFSWIISMTFNFILNRNVTFSARESSLVEQLVKWLTLHLVGFLCRLGIGQVVLIVAGETTLNANIAFIGGLIVSTPIIFFGSLFWAFRKN